MPFARLIATVLLAASLAGVCGYRANHATTRLTDDLSELLKHAKAVAEVVVLEQSVQPDSKVSLPLTLVTLEVKKVYKGELKPSTRITAEYFGGFDGKLNVVVPAQPALAPGQHAILLLTRNDQQSANWRVVGGDVGQVSLSSANGQTTARRNAGRFEYFVRNKQSITGYSPVSAETLTQERLGELLEATIATGRPVLEREEPAGAKAAPEAQPQPVPQMQPVPMASPTVAAVEPSGWMRMFWVLGLTTLGLLVIRRLR